MIYTGRFSDIKIYEHVGLIPVSIAGYAPDDYQATMERYEEIIKAKLL